MASLITEPCKARQG